MKWLILLHFSPNLHTHSYTFFAIFRERDILWKIRYMRLFILMWSALFWSRSLLWTLIEVAPHCGRLEGTKFNGNLQHHGRNSNRCCVLATGVAFVEDSTLSSFRYILNFVRSKNNALLWRYTISHLHFFLKGKIPQFRFPHLPSKGLITNFF